MTLQHVRQAQRSETCGTLFCGLRYGLRRCSREDLTDWLAKVLLDLASSCDYAESKRECLRYKFRLHDDDGELYYEGLADDPNSEDAFGPLDDFGKGSAGCTDIYYLRNGKWESL